MFDLSDLERIASMGQLAPESMAGFKALDQAATRQWSDPKKYKERMAIAVAFST